MLHGGWAIRRSWLRVRRARVSFWAGRHAIRIYERSWKRPGTGMSNAGPPSCPRHSQSWRSSLRYSRRPSRKAPDLSMSDLSTLEGLRLDAAPAEDQALATAHFPARARVHTAGKFLRIADE